MEPKDLIRHWQKTIVRWRMLTHLEIWELIDQVVDALNEDRDSVTYRIPAPIDDCMEPLVYSAVAAELGISEVFVLQQDGRCTVIYVNVNRLREVTADL